MAGYNDTKAMIISTLMGRPAGTEIQPENQQAYELNMLDYIRSLELISSSPIIGVADETTTPVQPDDARVSYIAGIAQNRTMTFQNFIGQDGQPLSVTTSDMEAYLVILLWNAQYWTMQAIPTNIVSSAENANFYYNYNIRKTYASVAAMNADAANPIGIDGKPIKLGDMVSVVNTSNPEQNGFYSRIEGGWQFQSSYNFQLSQTTGTDVNIGMSQAAITNLFNQLEASVDILRNEIPSVANGDFEFFSGYASRTASADADAYWVMELVSLSVTSFTISQFKAFVQLKTAGTPATVEIYSVSPENVVLAKIASWFANADGDTSFTPSSPVKIDYAQRILVRCLNGNFKYNPSSMANYNFYDQSGLPTSDPVGKKFNLGNKFANNCVSVNLIGTASYYNLKSSITDLNNQVALPIYNVTKQVPLASGSYYTAVTSRTAVPLANRKGGLILVYQDQTDGWMAHQYMGTDEQAVVNSSWTQATLWQFIGTGKTLTDMQRTLEQVFSLFATTDNLYSNALNVNGYIINNTGQVVPTNGIISYQPAEPNTEYVIRGMSNWNPTSVGLLGYCDSAKTIIGTADMSKLESYKNGKVFTTPENTAYVLFNVFVLNKDFRNTIEFYKGKDTVPDIYTAPITLPGLIQLDKSLSNFKTEQAAINSDLYSRVSIDSMDTSGNAEWGSILRDTSGSIDPVYYWNQWTPLEYDAIITKVNLNPLRVASITSWRDGDIKFGIAIAKPVEGSSTGQIECVSVTTFDYVKGATEVDISDLNIRVPAGYYALFSSVYLGTNANTANVTTYGYRSTPGGKTQYFGNATVGAKSVTFAGGILQYDQMLTFNVQEPLVEKVKDNDRRITALENQEPDEKANEVSIDTVTDVMFLGSSLTLSHYQPKSTSWIERLNDMVDVVIVNNGVSGYNLGTNMGQLVENKPLDKDSGNTPKNLKPKYIWWGNSANGTPAGANGIMQLMNAMEITASYGAKMILGSEEDYSNIAKPLEDTYRAFSAQHDVPYSPMIQVWKKCYPTNNPYKGWIASRHSGYRAMAPYNMHRDLLSCIPIEKSVKMYKVRTTYKTGAPAIEDLAYDTIDQRLQFFTAISAGAADSVGTGAVDNLDDHSYDVPGGNNTGISTSETSMMKRSAPVTFNKWGLIEFILDNVNITKGNFEILCNVQPLKVYVAITKNASTTYTDAPRTQFVEVAFNYSAGKVTATVEREDYDIQLFDKVRFIIQYSGSFTLANPKFSGYNGRAKAKKPKALRGYHYRQYGTELNDNTGFPLTGHGWTLAGGAAVKALPDEIANYTSYNTEKSHLQLQTDSSTATKSIPITEPTTKVAIRVVGCIWPKLATTRFASTAIADSEYIDATAPQVVTYDYDYGTLELTVNTNIIRKQVVLQGWFEMYFEIDVDPTDTALNVKLGRKCFVDSSYKNADNPILIHDVSVQLLK